jgi:hypothetical protein
MSYDCFAVQFGRSSPTFQKYLLLHNQGALMWEAASASETSVNFYQTTRRNNPEDSHLHTHRSENLKSQTESIVCCTVDKNRFQ